MVRGSILRDRFLLSLAAGALGPRSKSKVLNLLGQLSTPPEFAESIRRLLSSSPFVHFGFEAEGGAGVLKVYFEQRAPVGPQSPVLLHYAFKWRVGDDGGRVKSQYVWHPRLSQEGIDQRVLGLLGADSSIGRVTLQLRQRAFSTMNRGSIRFLEVIDEGTRRRSFDLNLYDANVRIVDIEAELAEVCRVLGIEPSELSALCRPIRTSRVGHIAGGIHRDGHEFFTVYHGVESRHG